MLLMQSGSENANPIIPPAWEATTLLAGLAIAILFIAALISIIRNKHQTPVGTALWILVVLAVPVLGPLVWFLAGNRSSRTSPTAS